MKRDTLWRLIAAAVAAWGLATIDDGRLAAAERATPVADWPQWRGPSRDGQAPDWKLPAAWDSPPTQVWKVEVGLGHASPVIADGRVFQFSRRGEQETLACFDLEGKQLWKKSYDAPYQVNPAAVDHGKGPKATPTVADGKVFTLGIGGIVSGWSAKDGKLLWRREFSKEFKSTSPLFGAAASPLAVDGAVVLPVGGHDSGGLVALEADSGKTRWSWTEDGPAYTSPILVSSGKSRQIITQTQTRSAGFDLKGQLLWSFPFETRYVQNIVTPLAVDELVVFSGYDRNVAAYRLASLAGAKTPQPAWENNDVTMYMSSPVLAAGRLIGFSQFKKGQFFALDPASGKLLWTGPGRQGDNGLLIAAGDKVVAALTTGELVVIGAGDSYQEAARFRLSDSAIWAHPAPCGEGVLVKDAEQLSLWRWSK